MSAVVAMPSAPAGSGATSLAAQVAAGRAAQPAWAGMALRERLVIVRRLRSLLAQHADTLVEAVQSSRGTPRAEILAGEVLPLADACRFLEREAAGLLRPRRLGNRGRPLWLFGVTSEIRREPYGTVLVIGPFNYPLLLPGVQALQALVAGNSVLLKPGQGGSRAAAALVGLVHAAGLDPRLLQWLPESANAARDAIDLGVDKVVLTGSADTGEKVLAQLAPQLVPATLELSGCDAVFVRADADLDLVARALRFGLTWNRGATCIAPRRVFVAAAVASALEERLRALLATTLPVALDPKTERLVRDALQRGARPLTAWNDAAPLTGPVVLTNACVRMPLLREDCFAPVLALVSVADDEAALAAASQCPYALGATIFGAELAARALAGRVRAGVVVINDVIVPTADPRLPFGGRGRSGYGVTRGADGLLDMTVLKVIAVRRGRAHWHLDPPDAADHELFQLYLEWMHRATWLARWRAGCALFGKLWSRGLHGTSPRK